MAKADPYGCWNGAGDEELDNMLGSILDFPDFLMESLGGGDLVSGGGDWDDTKSQHLGPIPVDVLMCAPATELDSGPQVSMRRPVSFIDAKQQTCRFEDAAGSCIPRQNKSAEVQETGAFQSQSPVSVLENCGSSLAGKSLPPKSHNAKGTRSKIARPSSVASPWLLLSPMFFTSRGTSDSRKTGERRTKSPHMFAKQTTEDSSGTARYTPEASDDYTEAATAARQRPTKKCTHCEITKTPQWREGPLGPKTLCNACGVRYRSGRLFPEYRPAASPTFVPSLHSNSHKKVVEMRSKGKHQASGKENRAGCWANI